MSNRSASIFSSESSSISNKSTTEVFGTKNVRGNGVLRKHSSRIGDKEWENSLWSEERLSAVNKAMDRVYEMSLDEDNFDLFGNDMIQCFYDVGTVTGILFTSTISSHANIWSYYFLSLLYLPLFEILSFVLTGEPVRQKALKYVEHLANRWKYTVMQRGWIEDLEKGPTPYEVIDAIIGMYCMERVGIRHDLKVLIIISHSILDNRL